MPAYAEPLSGRVGIGTFNRARVKIFHIITFSGRVFSGKIIPLIIAYCNITRLLLTELSILGQRLSILGQVPRL